MIPPCGIKLAVLCVLCALCALCALCGENGFLYVPALRDVFRGKKGFLCAFVALCEKN